jgi:hypothetical protein
MKTNKRIFTEIVEENKPFNDGSYIIWKLNYEEHAIKLVHKNTSGNSAVLGTINVNEDTININIAGTYTIKLIKHIALHYDEIKETFKDQ